MPESKPRATILVVDDNEINRDLLQLRLEVAGYAVVLAEHGREAMEHLRPKTILDDLHNVPGLSFDLVLLDIMMPEISGIDVLRYARTHYTMADLPIIMVTAKDESEDFVEALGYGANDYVTKPIDFPVLLARVQTALQVKRLTQQKDEFLAIASHDLKNPLAVVRGFVRMVKMIAPAGTPMTAEGIEMLQRAEAQTGTMERIITDYLDFQAMEDGQLRVTIAPMDVSAVLAAVVDNLQAYAREKEVILQAGTGGAALLAAADRERVEQVLLNLVGNAIKFNKKGGSVVVQAKPQGDSIRVEVSDTGPGIPEAERSRLFQKYARISNQPTGGEKSSGLGLVICKRIVELHGGEIGAEPNAGVQGTTFWFTLPISPAGHRNE